MSGLTRLTTDPGLLGRAQLLLRCCATPGDSVVKVRGLGEEKARTAPIPTSPIMSPAGVLNHLRWVEWSWVNEDLFGGRR